MKTAWSTGSMRRKCSAWSRISAARQVAAEPHLPGRAERAGQRAARLRGEAERAAAVAVAHQHGLDGAPVGGREQRLDGAVARVRLVARAQRRERHAPPRARRAARPAGRSSPRRSRRRAAVQRPDLAGAVGGLAVRGERRVEQRRDPSRLSLAAVRLAKYLAHAGVASRRAAEELIADGRVTRRRRGRRLDPARDVGDAQRGRASTAAPSRGPRSRASSTRSQAGRRRSTARDTARPPDRGRASSPDARPPLPGRPPRRRHDRPDPAHQRRRAGQPADAPALRGAARPTARASAAARSSGGAARAARRASSSTTARRRRRRCAGSPPTVLELRSTRAASARCGGCARRSATRCASCERVALRPAASSASWRRASTAG